MTLISLRKSITAGFMIGIGSVVYLSSPSKLVGAVLFSIALFFICSFRLNLFTGMAGYVVERKNYTEFLLTWLGNLMGVLLSVLPVRAIAPHLIDVSQEITKSKSSQSTFTTLVLGAMCGVLMYLAVENYNTNPHDVGKYLGVFLCVPVFILCGFEHSIANMSFFAFSVNSLRELMVAIRVVTLTTVSNVLGSLLFRLLGRNKHEQRT